jgi:6-phosphogluconolactonase (cycloisomerase 2 family)
MDGFECIPKIRKDNTTDAFLATQTTSENTFKIYYDLSPLNIESDSSHVLVRFLSIDSNSNPIISKYPLGVYIAEKQSDTVGYFIEVPAHIFIAPSNTEIVGAIRIDPSDKIPKIVASIGPTVYRDITYQDYDTVKNSGINKFYRSQIKLLELPSSNSFSNTGSAWSVVVRGSTSLSTATASITVSSSVGISVGLNASGAGIPNGTTVLSISGTTVRLSATPTATAGTTVSFSIGETFINKTDSGLASEYSSQIIIKPVFISNLLGFNSDGKEYIGIADFKSRITSSGALFTSSNTASTEFYPFEFRYPVNEPEKLIQYKFTLYDSSKVEIDSSGLIEVQRYLNQTAISWTNQVSLVDNATYYLSTYFKTESGFEYTKRYQITADYTLTPLAITFTTSNDRENGRIQFEMSSMSTSSNAIMLLRSSADEGFDNFKTLALFSSSAANDAVLLASSTVSRFSISTQETAPSDLFFKPEGDIMYVMGNSGDDINQYNLSSPWSVSSAVFSGSSAALATESNPKGMFFKPDGTKAFVIGDGKRRILQYDLSVPWAIGTLSNSTLTNSNFQVADTLPAGMVFKPEGDKVFIVGETNDKVYEYALTSAWTASSTVNASVSFSVAAQSLNPRSLAFNTSGTEMYILQGLNTPSIFKYYLPTAWSIATATYSKVFYTPGNFTASGSATGIIYNAEINKTYIIDATSDAVFEYNNIIPKKYFYDYLIEPGMLYRYKFQAANINSQGEVISRGASTTASAQPQVISDFTGSFLYGADDIQINFIHNGQINSFKETKRDVLIETIGGKYPFVIRNSNIGYKQFQFSALITHVSDPTRSLKGLTYSDLLNDNIKDSDSNFSRNLDSQSTLIDIRYEDFILNGSTVSTSTASTYSSLSENGKVSINRQDYIARTENYVVEKQFRKKVIQWLSDGEPKVFKSDTEGLFMVKLTDITFEPVVETGRILYTFSCTMTEIDSMEYASQVKNGIKKQKYLSTDLYSLSNIESFTIQWSADVTLPEGQYFYVPDTATQIRYYKVITTGTTGRFAPTDTQIDPHNGVYTSFNATYSYIFVGYSIPGRF